MGKRTGGGGPSSVKVKGPPRYWCYYCDTRHEGELQLIQHQRHKHFLCRLCDPKSYGRNCLSLSGLISHVRRSHRQEITEVPGAIEGRRSTDVEVSGMNGIPQQALDTFEEKIAEEMLAYWPGRAAEPPPDSSDEEEEAAPAKEPVKPKEADSKDSKRPVVVPDMAWIASQLATSDGQYNNLELERPNISLPGLPTPSANKDIKAFDPSLLAQVAAGNQVPVMVEERQNLAREEEEAKHKAEERVRKDEEKRRRAISIAFLPKKDKDEPVVPKVDKSVVSDLGSAIAARAAMAKASETAKSNFKTMPTTLRTKLVAMQPGALLKFAVEAGVVKDDIMKANGSKDVITQLILNLDTEESWKNIPFKAGKIGLKADWARGEVESVTVGGQGDILGVKVGWIFKTVDGERFCKASLQERIAGVLDYKAVFATSESALGKSRQKGGGRYLADGTLRPPKKKPKVEKEAAAKPQGEEEEYEYTDDEGEFEGQVADGQEKKGKRKHRQRAAEEDHCLPGECEEEEHCLPGEEEAEEGAPARGDDNGGRKAKEPRRREYEAEEQPRRSRRTRDNGVEDDYREDRRGRRYDDRRRYEYEEDDYEEEEEEEEYERPRGRGRRGRREDYEYEDDRRGRDRRPRGRERAEEYDPYEEQPEEEEEAPKGEVDPKRKRGVQRLLPREEKVAAK